MIFPLSKENKKIIAREDALRRASHKCPVIKAANKVLDECEAMDLRHAIDVISIELRYMPEGAATAELLARLCRVDDGATDGL